MIAADRLIRHMQGLVFPNYFADFHGFACVVDELGFHDIAADGPE